MLVGCPTGLLASDYNDTFAGQITSNTIHSAFQFPVNKHQRPTINWNISNFDVLIIDEVSMIPQKIAEHVVTTLQQLPIRPLVVVCGDNQQQPIETVQVRWLKSVVFLARRSSTLW